MLCSCNRLALKIRKFKERLMIYSDVALYSEFTSLEKVVPMAVSLRSLFYCTSLD